MYGNGTTTTVIQGSTLEIDSIPNAVSLTIASSSVVQTYDVAAGKAVIPAETTASLPSGSYQSQWRTEDAGKVEIVPGPRIVLRHSFSRGPVPRTDDEKLLAAARKALVTAAEGTQINVSSGETSIQFEGRSELLVFVSQLQARVNRAKRGTAFGIQQAESYVGY